jgi:hypothetical protein
MKFILLISLMTSVSFAGDLESFKTRFKIQRDEEGKLIGVRAPWVVQNFSLTAYLKQVKEDLVGHNQRYEKYLAAGPQGAAKFTAEVQAELEMLRTELSNSKSTGDDLETSIAELEKSLLNLPGEHSVEDLNFVSTDGLMEEYQLKLKDAFTKYSLDLIAEPNDPRHFYKLEVTYKVVSWALEQAKKRFSSVPLLNVATFIIVETHKLMMDQRAFSQNMMMYYLDNYKASELGLTDTEVNRIMSSIFESRIAWMNYMESNRAAASWERYGFDHYYALVRQGEKQLKNYVAINRDAVSMKKNYAFAEVTTASTHVMLNLLNTAHQYTGKPAVAYDFNKPTKVKNLRRLIRLGQFGLSFIPLPGFIKSTVNNFADSTYKAQRLTEGALVGYFEDNKNLVMRNEILSQQGNPFIY